MYKRFGTHSPTSLELLLRVCLNRCNTYVYIGQAMCVVLSILLNQINVVLC